MTPPTGGGDAGRSRSCWAGPRDAIDVQRGAGRGALAGSALSPRLPRLRNGEEPSPPESQPDAAASSSQAASAIPQEDQRRDAIQAAERAGRRRAVRRRAASAGEYGES